MLQVSPSLSLAKFLWSKPLPSSPAAMTVAATGESRSEPMKLDAADGSLDNMNTDNNRVSGMFQTAGLKNVEEESNTLKIIGLREFWNHQLKTSEGKWKEYVEQISSNQHRRAASFDTETGEVDWRAVRERIAWRWRLIQNKPDDMSIEEWQKLQEDGVKLPPWFIYKTCGLYSRLIDDAECRPIFQEFDFC